MPVPGTGLEFQVNVLNARLFIVEIVDDNIFAQVAGFGEKDPPVIQPRHSIHKHVENVPAWQHESIDDDARAGAVVHLS